MNNGVKEIYKTYLDISLCNDILIENKNNLMIDILIIIFQFIIYYSKGNVRMIQEFKFFFLLRMIIYLIF